MPYADAEVRRQKELEYRKKPEVRERNAELYRKRYAENKNGIADKTREKHYVRWSDEKYRAQKQQQYVKRWENDWAGQKIVQLRAKAKKQNLDFDIDALDLALPDVCPIFGIPLIKSTGRLSNNSPSVDRIDPLKGYVKGNVVVVSNKANSIKRDATVCELKKMVEFYENLMSERTKNE
jgi:hypothetical protein